MTGKDKAHRKELLRRVKEERYADARRTLGLGPDELAALLEDLDRRLANAPCDHTLRLTRGWAEQTGKPADAVAAAVRNLGGYCDCEVLANVTPDQFGWQG